MHINDINVSKFHLQTFCGGHITDTTTRYIIQKSSIFHQSSNNYDWRGVSENPYFSVNSNDINLEEMVCKSLKSEYYRCFLTLCNYFLDKDDMYLILGVGSSL